MGKNNLHHNNPPFKTKLLSAVTSSAYILKVSIALTVTRIRDLNQLSTHQAAFLRLLKQTFFNYEVSIKQQRFFILDQDKMPLAIFEYRDGTQSFKAMDYEDGIPVYTYKALISSEALQQDLEMLLQQRPSH
ncbi:hypothetical protein [Acinetobacter brisouii]|uniref:hypothetical protein n=1 Tax=Acinetobacter brisouii TaxID=396323 RepID=UPI0035AF17F7